MKFEKEPTYFSLQKLFKLAKQTKKQTKTNTYLYFFQKLKLAKMLCQFELCLSLKFVYSLLFEVCKNGLKFAKSYLYFAKTVWSLRKKQKKQKQKQKRKMKNEKDLYASLTETWCMVHTGQISVPPPDRDWSLLVNMVRRFNGTVVQWDQSMQRSYIALSTLIHIYPP